MFVLAGLLLLWSVVAFVGAATSPCHSSSGADCSFQDAFNKKSSEAAAGIGLVLGLTFAAIGMALRPRQPVKPNH